MLPEPFRANGSDYIHWRREGAAGSLCVPGHDPQKVGTGFPKKVMFEQRDEIMIRLGS
jgi:hypothetical protein